MKNISDIISRHGLGTIYIYNTCNFWKTKLGLYMYKDSSTENTWNVM